MKFVLFVEGQTERAALNGFLKRWLDPRLNWRVGIQIVRFNGCKSFMEEAAKKARLHLKQADVIAVIGLLDLYGLDIYPSNQVSAAQRVSWAKKHLENEVDEDRFRQFFAVHETEAWLLSDPTIFPREIQQDVQRTRRNPEDVDFDTPPAKLLNQFYRKSTGKDYKKVVYGEDLFKKLDPQVVYDKCPHFKEMMDEMLHLARDSEH